MAMPEYSSPGVYVEEVGANATSIAGVSNSIDSASLQSLVAVVREIFGNGAPAWTDLNDTDPAVTLIELFAWLTENLVYAANTIPERSRQAALRAAALLSGLGNPCAMKCEPLKRPSFFAGQLLDAATLREEQDYHREKLRRHNRELHGIGIVHGLGVRVEPTSDADGWRIIVAPGYAIDQCGEEIAVCASTLLAPPRDANEAFVTLRFWEHRCPAVSPSESGMPNAVCIEEACVLGVAKQVLPPALAVSRLIRSDGSWHIDPEFLPPRAGSVMT